MSIARSLNKLIKRVESFNQEEHPVRIIGIGLTGSALRKENPVDYDVVVICQGKEPYWSEWKRFEKALNDNFRKLVELIYRIPGKDRKSIKKLLNHFRNEVERLINPKWVNKWLIWCRISDFEKGLKYGIPIRYFTLPELISRYLKKGVSRKFQIIPIIYNPKGELQSIEFAYLAYVLVWTIEKGFREVSDKDLLDFLNREWKELTDTARSLLYENDLTKIPRIYYSIARLLRQELMEEVPSKFIPLSLNKQL